MADTPRKNWFARALDAAASTETNPLALAWRALPPNVRASYASLPNAVAELTPGAAIRDTVQASGETAKAAMEGRGWDAAGGVANMLAAAAGVVPGGKLVVKGAKAANPIRAYHGSPHDFDRFDMSKIGTGEGAQAYGHGLYFAEDPSVAKTYQSKVSAMRGSGTPTIGGKPIDWDDPAQAAAFELARHNGDRIAAADFHERTFKGDGTVAKLLRSGVELPSVKYPGHMYEVAIKADPEKFLDWDKPLVKQSKPVREAWEDFVASGGGAKMNEGFPFASYQENPHFKNPYGSTMYRQIPGSVEAANAALVERGIPGIKYLDGGSRAAGDGSRNYVVFDDKLIEILRKYGLLPVAAGGAAVAANPLSTGEEGAY